MKSIAASISTAFRENIDQLDWITPASKQGAFQKIDNLVLNIAYTGWVLDDAKLSEYYKKLGTVQTDTFLDQQDKVTAFSIYEMLFVLGTPVDRTIFANEIYITNAWDNVELNSVSIPAGILNGPFYDYNYPAAVNYGGIGSITGEEIALLFDSDGLQWDGTGVLNSWMDDSSMIGLTNMTQCVVNEYSNFCPLGPGNPCVNGTKTQAENVADNGGLQAVYKAFKSFETLNGPDPLLPGAASSFNAFGILICPSISNDHPKSGTESSIQPGLP
ncbi:hypothetical protein PENTCL1PPCAC_23782 [Pristionchus entomophagus]|uniref:Peptidase M13 C-terminal domain-containing protein n=1 Tax=Pristionchus entomophagus TaxID=358040 RepID=A0AAV5U4Q6_9BILA|nr:hypothetical protein PENTCL1PPCAC_23782 [Pristionchus entomophagus]